MLGFVGRMNFRKCLRNRERGATLIEAAVVLPILLLVVLGIIEFGLAFKDYLTVSYLSREGARIGALAGDDAEADCAIVTGLGDLITTHDLERLTRIEIYKADPDSGAQGSDYNIATYVPGKDPTVCTVPADPVNDGWSFSQAGAGWNPTSRDVSVGTTGGATLDILGVRVILVREWVTGFGPFSGTATVDESTITRMEPEVYE